jgi:hypothetical protein
MTTPTPNNPFALPGFGQTGEAASNPLFASLEMMRQTFSTLSGGGGLANGLQVQPTLDPAELEKKIAELKSVESWLKLNLSMLSSTIQGMEVQLATITTLRQFVSANGWPNATATTPSAPTAQEEAAQGWWNMLTEQFGQMASATSASMQTANAPISSAKKTVAKKRAPIKKPSASKNSNK